jgi:hypothetical protein
VETLPDMKVGIEVVWLRDKKFIKYEVEENHLNLKLSNFKKYFL